MCAGAVYRSIYIINLRRNKAKIGEKKKVHDKGRTAEDCEHKKRQEKSKQIYWSVYS